jgi:hypothetical protein
MMTLIELKKNIKEKSLQEITLFIESNKDNLFSQVYDVENSESIWNLLGISEITLQAESYYNDDSYSTNYYLQLGDRFTYNNEPSDEMFDEYEDEFLDKITSVLDDLQQTLTIAYKAGYKNIKVNKTGFHFS